LFFVLPSFLGWLILIIRTKGTIHRVEKAKIAVLAAGIESSKTEAKGTVILDTADRLVEFSKGEEKIIEQVNILPIVLLRKQYD